MKLSRKVADVEVASVRKKMKDKAFARSVSRDDIIEGAAGLQIDLDTHIAFCLKAMQHAADTIGL
ncbi:MAG: metal dependent phosphohydrolase [Bryobacterales bacterium]|nr:metal dependent phosphohydrolase [Bryobacterales bacterium]